MHKKKSEIIELLYSLALLHISSSWQEMIRSIPRRMTEGTTQESTIKPSLPRVSSSFLMVVLGMIL